MRWNLPALLAAALLGGCASAGTPPVRPPSPPELAALQHRFAHDSSSVPARLRLATAYRDAGRPAAARALLQPLSATRPRDADVALLLGSVDEDLGDFAAARGLYERYLREGRSERLRAEVQRRLPLLERKELQASVRSALAHEAELANTPPQPHTVAVFPFTPPATDTALAPLSRALAEMLVTDLSLTSRIRVLERLRVQLLLDEARLGSSGRVDPRTAVRGGRLLGAGRVLQGALLVPAPDQLRLEAAVVPVTAGAGAARPPEQQRMVAPPRASASAAERVVPLAEAGGLARVIDMEKDLALKTYAALGVELTAAERERVLQRRTENVQALLAYGRGLEASDAGDFQAAARYFQAALARDPNFSTAREAEHAATANAAAARVSTGELAHLALAAAAPTGLAATTPAVLGAAALAGPPTPFNRDPVSELLGTEGLGNATVVDVVVQRPDGGN